MNGVCISHARIRPRIHRPRLSEALLALALLPLVLCVCGVLLLLWPASRMEWYEGLCCDCLEPIHKCRCGGCDA